MNGVKAPFLSTPLGGKDNAEGFLVMLRDNDPSDSTSQPSGNVYHVKSLTREMCLDAHKEVTRLALKPVMHLALDANSNTIMALAPGSTLSSKAIDRGYKLIKKQPISILKEFLPLEQLRMVVISTVVETGEMNLADATSTVDAHIKKLMSVSQENALLSLGYNPKKLLPTATSVVQNSTVDVKATVVASNKK
jgi:hypothetical protein